MLSALTADGSATALTAGERDRVPRTTICRRLQTLLDKGYVGRGIVGGKPVRRIPGRLEANEIGERSESGAGHILRHNCAAVEKHPPALS